MPHINIFLTDADHARLHELAACMQVDPLALAETFLWQRLRPPAPAIPPDDFQRVVEQTLTKNAELYRRLAKHDCSPEGAARE